MQNQGYKPTNQYASPYDPYAQQQPQYPQFQGNGAGWYGQQQGGAPVQPTAQPKATQQKRSGGSGAGNGGRKKPKKGKSMTGTLIKIVVVLVLLAGLGIGGYIWKVRSDVEPYASVFLDNISVDGIDLSGMTWEQGQSAVWEQARAKQNSWYVRLENEHGYSQNITAEYLGISFDPAQALQQAWAIGHTSSGDQGLNIFELQDEVQRMKEGGAAFASVEQSGDLTKVDAIIQQLETAAYREPVNAWLSVFDKDDTLNPFSIELDKAGQRLKNPTGLREQIVHMVQTLQSGTITVETEAIPAAVTEEDIKKTVSLRYRAVTPIDKHSTSQRTDNIGVAFDRINGLVLEDGKKFSFNSVAGKRSTENGYYEALEIAYGEYVMGVGGGVCQASTTVYLAAIQSGMTITKRTAHSNPVSYTNMGMDATVSDTKGREIDFAFRNESGGTIYIQAHVIPDPANKNRLMCEVKIYGPSLENTQYRLESELVQTLAKPEPTYMPDKEAKHVIYTDEEKQVSSGSEGHVVDTYLCTIVDGVQVDRKKISTDTYPARPPQIYVGVSPRYVEY